MVATTELHDLTIGHRALPMGLWTMDCKLKLLGSFAVELGDRPVPPSQLNRKTRAILAYLEATRVSHSRRKLYNLFCHDAQDPAGTLRWHLSRIRRQLDEHVLVVTRREVAVNNARVQSDLFDFETAVVNLDKLSIGDLAQAIGLYQGPFLAGLSLPDSPEFDLWLLGERARYQQLFEKGSLALIGRYGRLGQYNDALSLAQALVQSNPLLEEAHRDLIWLYAQSGQRESALYQYEQCSRLLWLELAVEPSPDTQALYDAIHQNRPLPALSLEADALPIQAVPTVNSKFVGRRAELRKMHSIWQSAKVSGGEVVIVEAPAGGGKTRFVQEYLQGHLPNMPVYAGQCYESTRSIPYQPWLTILEGYLSALAKPAVAQLSSHWRQQLSLVMPDLSKPGQTAVALDQQQLFQAIAHLLTRLPNREPYRIFVDDLQWADEASLQLLQFVVQQLAQATTRILIIGSFRGEEVEDNPALLTFLQDLPRTGRFSRIVLPSLNAGETEQLIAELWPELHADVHQPGLRDALLQATGGNPLFTVEILQDLSPAEAVPSELPIPPSLTDLIALRLNRIPANGRQVIEALAVLDQSTHFDLAQQISGRSENETLVAIEMGLRWRLLQSDAKTRYDFCHDLFRTAVLAQLSDARRLVLHRRAAKALSQHGAAPAKLAYHWRMANDTEQELKYATLAGETAARVYANDEAIRHYQRALELAVEVKARISLMLTLGQIWQLTGQWNKAEALFMGGLELAQRVQQSHYIADACYYLGQSAANRGHYVEADEYYRRARRLYLDQQNQGGLCRVAGGIGYIYMRQSQHEKALTHFREQYELAQLTDDIAAAAEALNSIGAISYQRGEYDDALDYCRQCLPLYEKMGNRVEAGAIIGNMGLIQMRRGAYQEAMGSFEQRLVIAQELDHRQGIVHALNSMGTIYRLQGELVNALTCFQHNATMSLELGDEQALSLAIANIGGTILLDGRYDEAQHALELGITLARRMNLRFMLCAYLYEKVNLLMQQQRWQEAQMLNEEVLDIATNIKRQDTRFKSRVASVRLHYMLAKYTSAEAVDQLQAMLLDRSDMSEEADLYYAMWQIEPAEERYALKAANRYKALFSRTPEYHFRKRYREITNKDLPKPVPLPPLPASVPSTPDSVTDLLRQVDDLLSSSPVPES